METAENINKILLTMSQAALGRKIGLKQSAISSLSTGESTPSAATCLALAGVCPKEDVAYWHRESGLSEEVLANIAAGFAVEVKGERLSKREKVMLHLYRDTGLDQLRRAAFDLIDKILDQATK